MKAANSAQAIEFEEATSYRRLGARLIDLVLALIVLFLPSALLAGGIGMLVAGEDSDLAATVSGWLMLVLFIVLAAAYDTIFHRLFGKTVGKMLLGMRVVDERGKNLSWGRCLARTIVLYLTGLGIVALTVATASILGWVFIGGLRRYRRFPQDSVSRSFVVLESKGELKKAAVTGTPGIALVGPAADLERLRSQGLISEEEYQRKRKEIRK
jgi:uncharacterized RDD family membrane protein YckC